MKELLSLMGLARKANMLSLGFDAVKTAAEKGRAKVVFLARDLSPNTERRIRFYLSKIGVPSLCLDADMEEFEAALGKKVGIVSIDDTGFAERAIELLKAQNGRRTPLC